MSVNKKTVILYCATHIVVTVASFAKVTAVLVFSFMASSVQKKGGKIEMAYGGGGLLGFQDFT